MAAGALGSIIDQFDNHDRCLPRHSARLSSIRLPLVLAACAIVLTACAWDPPTIERTPREAAGAETSAKSRLASRKGGAQNGAATSGATGEKIDVPGESAALEMDLTNFKERLIGLDSDEINDLMGTPSLERAEPPALIWQYRHQVCTVDLFMFDDGGGSTVDHVEVLPASGGVSDKDCFTALLRNVTPVSAASAKATTGQQPIAPSPSTPVGRRPTPSAAPPSGPAQTPSSSRPPVPSTAAPSAAPTPPAARPAAAAAAIPEGEEGPPPTDTDIDFDFGAGAAPALPAAPSAAPSAASPAARASEAIPTLPPELNDTPPGPSSARDSALDGIDMPSGAIGGDDDEFADPTDSAPPKAPAPAPAATAKPSTAKPAAPAVAAPIAKPAPAPLAAVPPAPVPAPTPAPVPVVVPPSVPAVVTPPPPSVAAVPTPAAPSTGPAQLTPRGGTTTTAAAQPKGAVKGATKGAAARAADDVDDEDLPPGLPGLRADDPSRNNEDMVE